MIKPVRQLVESFAGRDGGAQDELDELIFEFLSSPLDDRKLTFV